MAISIRRGVGIPPSGIIDRFISPMLAVARTWIDVSRAGYPVEITSWWRPPARNELVPGAQEYSQHLVATAIDAVSPVGQGRLFAAASSAAARYGTQAILSNNGAVHVQGLPYGMVRALLTREPNLVGDAAVLYGPSRYLGVNY